MNLNGEDISKVDEPSAFKESQVWGDLLERLGGWTRVTISFKPYSHGGVEK